MQSSCSATNTDCKRKAVAHVNIAVYSKYVMAISRRQSIDLPPRSREGIFNYHSCIFVSCVVGAGVVHHNVFVWWNRQPNVDLKSDRVAMFLTGSDHLHAATRNAPVMIFQPLYFTQYLGASSVRGVGAFERDLWRDLHLFPRMALRFNLRANHSGTEWLHCTSDSAACLFVQVFGPAWMSDL